MYLPQIGNQQLTKVQFGERMAFAEIAYSCMGEGLLIGAEMSWGSA